MTSPTKQDKDRHGVEAQLNGPGGYFLTTRVAEQLEPLNLPLIVTEVREQGDSPHKTPPKQEEAQRQGCAE
jgi:hypothetical protein